MTETATGTITTVAGSTCASRTTSHAITKAHPQRARARVGAVANRHHAAIDASPRLIASDSLRICTFHIAYFACRAMPTKASTVAAAITRERRKRNAGVHSANTTAQ